MKSTTKPGSYGAITKPTPRPFPQSMLYLFYFNVFFACVSFALVLPSLWPYLEEMESSTTFLAGCVSIYSFGELLGALLLGALYDVLGSKPILLGSIFTGIVGSFMYGSAAFFGPRFGPWLVFVGRFLQGIWTGGQQSVETAYVGENVAEDRQTEIITNVSTFACMGFVLGPAIATPLEMVDFWVGNYHVNRNMVPGFFIMVCGSVMFTLSTFIFDGATRSLSRKNKVSPLSIRDSELMSLNPSRTRRPTFVNKMKNALCGDTTKNRDLLPPSTAGIVVLMFGFLVHFEGFAIQETVTTVLVMREFGWSEEYGNYLFTAAGGFSLMTFVLVGFLSRYVPDFPLLVSSLVIGLFGYLVLIRWPGPYRLGVFLFGFAVITVAFPLGRGIVISMYSKVLGPHDKGKYMGWMFTAGAVSRIIAPLCAVQLYEAYGPTLMFGSTAALFALSLVLVLLWKKDVMPHVQGEGLVMKSADEGMNPNYFITSTPGTPNISATIPRNKKTLCC